MLNLPKLNKSSHTGFAAIPLVVLLLFGIAAGTLLVQSGVNFLPKAQEPIEGFFQCSPQAIGTGPANSCKKINFHHCDYTKKGTDEKLGASGTDLNGCQIAFDASSKDRNSNIDIQFYCSWSPPLCPPSWDHPASAPTIRVKYDNLCFTENGKDNRYSVIRGQGIDNTATVPCNNVSRPCGDSIKTFCAERNMQCVPDNLHEAHCESRKDSLFGALTSCTVENGQIKNAPSSECLQTGQKYLISHCELKTSSSSKVIGHQDCLSLQAPQNYNYYCGWDKQCPETAPAAGTTSVREVSAEACPGADPAFCRDKESTDCYKIDSKSRCAYKPKPEATNCNESDNRACSGKGGCELVEVTIKKGDQKIPIQYSRCINERPSSAAQPAAGTQPASGTQPRPAGAAAPATGTQPASATKPNGVTTAAGDCGYTRDGAPIPCYVVGVFANSDDLKATEAQAKIASERYTQAQSILDKVRSSLDREFADQAQRKLNDAKARALACMPK